MSRISGGRDLVLEGSEGSSNALIEIKTATKKESSDELRKSIEIWMQNPEFANLYDGAFDVAIVVFCNQMRMKRQDVDNIAKVVLDSLKSNKERRGLFKDDAQVYRLLIQKELKKDYEGYSTDDILISFRKYSPEKDMKLISRGSTY